MPDKQAVGALAHQAPYREASDVELRVEAAQVSEEHEMHFVTSTGITCKK